MKPNERYSKLEQHLSQENPVLLEIINTYRNLDKIGYKTGLLTKEQSYAEQISWWPLISVLGTFSAGKSSFINQYIQQELQETGNQAVDDKFTVICYGSNQEPNTLPGLALNADPRFPFFGIGKKIDKVEAGEGNRIDSYLQLKTVKSEVLKGKILIDSPGFDADSQRSSTLKITSHIIDMSDLVLVFFDARHPEPGAMRDTLKHLVANTIKRNDADKILFILNQIDTTAPEDNPEEVIAAWQRAIAQEGLVSGNFYTIYNEQSANIIEDPALAERFKRKKDIDMARILTRMEKVNTERAYRIANDAERIVNEIKTTKLPKIKQAIRRWRRKVIALDVLIIAGLTGLVIWAGLTMPVITANFSAWLQESLIKGLIFALVLLITACTINFFVRKKVVAWDAKRLAKQQPDIAHALLHNNCFWRGMFHKNPRGWGKATEKKCAIIVAESKQAIQKLTDQFADPSGVEPVPVPIPVKAE